MAEATGVQDALGALVGAGSVVLVNGVDRYAARFRAAGLGQLGAPGEVAFPADAKPVDGAENDGLLAVGVEDNAFSEERGFDAKGVDNERVAERRIRRWRHVGGEAGYAEGP